MGVQQFSWAAATPDSVVAAAAAKLHEPISGDGDHDIGAAVDAFLRQARIELGIDNADFSHDALERVDIFISSEIDRRLVEGFDENAVKESLGDRGDLPLGAYSVEDTSLFRDVFSREKLKFAASCIANAELVQHLFSPNMPAGEERKVFSFFAQRKQHNGKEAWMLVFTERKGSVLRVMALFRLPSSLYDMSALTSPMEMLKATALRYGLELTINGRPINRVWMQSEYIGLHDALSYLDPGNTDIAFHMMRRLDDGRVFLEFASAINLTQYRSDLLTA